MTLFFDAVQDFLKQKVIKLRISSEEKFRDPFRDKNLSIEKERQLIALQRALDATITAEDDRLISDHFKCAIDNARKVIGGLSLQHNKPQGTTEAGLDQLSILVTKIFQHFEQLNLLNFLDTEHPPSVYSFMLDIAEFIGYEIERRHTKSFVGRTIETLGLSHEPQFESALDNLLASSLTNIKDEVAKVRGAENLNGAIEHIISTAKETLIRHYNKVKEENSNVMTQLAQQTSAFNKHLARDKENWELPDFLNHRVKRKEELEAAEKLVNGWINEETPPESPKSPGPANSSTSSPPKPPSPPGAEKKQPRGATDPRMFEASKKGEESSAKQAAETISASP